MGGQVEPDKWPLDSRGSVDGRRLITECGGGGNLLMGLGKSQIKLPHCSNNPSQPRFSWAGVGSFREAFGQNFGLLSVNFRVVFG